MATPRRELSYGSVQIDYDEVLGIGSYGKVCKAKCGQLPCAAKLLHDTLFQDNDPGTHNLVSKFLHECQFLSTIKHPNIVQYLGTTRDPQSQRAVLLIELMDECLTRFLERLTGPLPYHSQLNTCHDVALALAYLHSNDIIHRDMSSNNVLLIGEGSRAKVTDFGMSKLMDINPRMTPLTQVPGTPAYMPPEALISPPHYSSKLDCFSYGVLILQIITRNFPDPGDASRYMDDPRYPTGRALVQFPEIERRKKDIDLIEPSHPLLPTALQCLKDRDTERPSADELCGKLASLKHSVEQTRGHVQRLQEDIGRKEQKEMTKATVVMETQRCQTNELVSKVPDACGGEKQPLEITWRQGQKAPEKMKSDSGAAVGHGSTAYFSSGCNVYSYTVAGNRWTKLPECGYQTFALAVVNEKLTTIGGHTPQEGVTNVLLSLSGTLWEEVLPPMPTNRQSPAAVTTPTHLVVAGGRTPHPLSTVELLNIETLQWSTASKLPKPVAYPGLTTCNGRIYLTTTKEADMFSCTLEDLLNERACSVWTEPANIPTRGWSTLATLRGRVLAIGGRGKAGRGSAQTRDVHCYNISANSWEVIGAMRTARRSVLTAVLLSDELVVVGGQPDRQCCEICR